MSTQDVTARTALPTESAALAAGVACCPPIAVRALDADQAGQIAPMFKALGDPVRLRLMSMIASTGEACVCDLTEAFEVSAPTISHHLKVLREAGLVTGERRGTWVFYRNRPDVLALLGGLLDLGDPTVRDGGADPGRTALAAPG